MKELISKYYEETDKINQSILSKPELELASGYGLFNTIIEYHFKSINDEINLEDTRLLQPHKMLLKLSKALEPNARKRDLKIELTKESSFTNVNIINLSDIYLAFFSLLENAIKYSLPGGIITIDIKDEQENAVVNIKNSCETIGDNCDKLNFRGFKGDNSKKDSNGLGLYFVNEIFKSGNIAHEYMCDEREFNVKVILKDRDPI
ncbi:MAG TPA: sensor histidine kinase [Acholeplasma sp.]|nr:sensor histidine kinase [Acholeplasma sp.]